MTLLIRISIEDFNIYGSQFLEILNKNLSNLFLKKIYVNINSSDVNIPVHNKLIVYSDTNLTNKSFIDIVRSKSSEKVIIFANPFAIFNNDIKRVSDFDLSKWYLSNENKFIAFGGSSRVTTSENLEDLIIGNKQIIDFGSESKREWKWMNGIGVTRGENGLATRTKGQISKTKNIKTRIKKLDVVIVSVDYNDYLSLTLEHNSKIFQNITIVTSETDQKCEEICQKWGAKCIKTNEMYSDGSKFNKGKAINIGLDSIENPDFILILDADIIVKNRIDLDLLEEDVLYTSDRKILESINDYNRWISDNNCKARIESNRGLGFFQLFQINNPVLNKGEIYPEDFGEANGCDLKFRDFFKKREKIDNQIIHLGPAYKNWKGRKSPFFTPGFESPVEIIEESTKDNFDINSYFDKIYCLNLDRRVDRWVKCKYQFKKYNIKVQRWSAVEGDNIPDEYFKNIVGKVITERTASNLGILENKWALACLMSHSCIIKDAKIRGYKRILIFEDDIEIQENFMEEMKNVLKINWKIIYPGYTQKSNQIHIKNGFFKSKKTLGTFAYGLDVSIFDEIIDLINSESKKSIDNLLSDIQEKNYGYCFSFYPSIVESNLKSESDIRGNRPSCTELESSTQSPSGLRYFKKSLIYNKKSAINNLIEVKLILDFYKVKWWLTDGTLLGMYRNSDFISHDLDLDIGVSSETFNPKVLQKLKSFGFEVEKSFGEVSSGFEISIKKSGVKIDLFFFYKENDSLWHAAWFSEDNFNFRMIRYNYKSFEISKNKFYGVLFNSPSNTEEYIIQKYGINWKITETNWDWKFSPKNHQLTQTHLNLEQMISSIKQVENLSNLYSKTTLIIKSFKRQKCLKNLIDSIRRFYAHITIVVVDDSGENLDIVFDDNTEVYEIEFDSGLSKGRNFAVSKVKTDYFVLLDDDFEFTESTDLSKWLNIIENSNLDILGGDVIMNDEAMVYNGVYEFESETKTLTYKNNFIEKFKDFATYDFILNFFIARTSSIHKNKWDDDLKLAEHTAFFFDNKNKIKVGHTSQVSINHQKVLEGEYIKFRKRGTEFFRNWMKKRNILKTINLKGEVYEYK
jgi:GR25 family glycosyltransferase involved in LPS biosynthesis